MSKKRYKINLYHKIKYKKRNILHIYHYESLKNNIN